VLSHAELVHIWNRCHACGAAPIIGPRFACQTCPTGADNDLCATCYQLFKRGQIEHPSPEAREAPAGRHLFRAFEGIERERALPWLAAPWSAALAPRVPDRSVVRPEFRSGGESFFGSYAFVVVLENGGPLLLTALHVLDELAKFRGIDCSDKNVSYTGGELPHQITDVQLYDPFAANWVLNRLGAARDMLPLPDARICSNEPYSQQDIAAFRLVPSSVFQPLRLATAPPRVGEPIWLAVNLGHGARQRAEQAVTVEITDKTFIFRFAAHDLPLYTSGAPLLNRTGEVVGINVGGGTFEKQKLGHGVSVLSVRHLLEWA